MTRDQTQAESLVKRRLLGFFRLLQADVGRGFKLHLRLRLLQYHVRAGVTGHVGALKNGGGQQVGVLGQGAAGAGRPWSQERLRGGLLLTSQGLLFHGVTNTFLRGFGEFTASLAVEKDAQTASQGVHFGFREKSNKNQNIRYKKPQM